jgi:hypothetical protein
VRKNPNPRAEGEERSAPREVAFFFLVRRENEKKERERELVPFRVRERKGERRK